MRYIITFNLFNLQLRIHIKIVTTVKQYKIKTELLK